MVSPCIAIEGAARAAATISMDIAASFENRDVFNQSPLSPNAADAFAQIIRDDCNPHVPKRAIISWTAQMWDN